MIPRKQKKQKQTAPQDNAPTAWRNFVVELSGFGHIQNTIPKREGNGDLCNPPSPHKGQKSIEDHFTAHNAIISYFVPNKRSPASPNPGTI